MAHLRKADVEALLAHYDADPVSALTGALRVVLDQPDSPWPQLVAALPASRRPALLAHDHDALDALAAELNELRTVATMAVPSPPPAEAAPASPLARAIPLPCSN